MECLPIAVGLTYSLLALTLTPLYLRIIYIFWSKFKYISLECYRIMIQIGVVQCLMAPGIFFVGLTHLLNEDPFKLASVTMKIMSTGIRMEALMNLVLALNRMRIICGFGYSTTIHSVLLTTIWLLGVLHFALLMTPHCNYLVIPGEFLSKYDYSKPYTETLTDVGSTLLICATCMTVITYGIVILYLIWTKRKLVHVKNAHEEKAILLYAGIRFVVDISLTICYYFVHLPHQPEFDIPLFLGYILNNLLLSPLLYLVMHKELRYDVMICKSTTRKVMTQTVTANLERRSC